MHKFTDKANASPSLVVVGSRKVGYQKVVFGGTADHNQKCFGKPDRVWKLATQEQMAEYAKKNPNNLLVEAATQEEVKAFEKQSKEAQKALEKANAEEAKEAERLAAEQKKADEEAAAEAARLADEAKNKQNGAQ